MIRYATAWPNPIRRIYTTRNSTAPNAKIPLAIKTRLTATIGVCQRSPIPAIGLYS
jgi:hypothetical protein